MGIIENIIKKYEEHIFVYNLLLVTIVVALAKIKKCLSVLSNLDDTFFGALAGIFVSILGFSMAAVSILIAIIHGINEENEKIKLVRSSWWYGRVYDMYFYTILFSGISAGLSILSMKSSSMVIRCLWVASSLLSVMYLSLSIVTLKLIVSLLAPKSKPKEEKATSQPNQKKIKEWNI